MDQSVQYIQWIQHGMSLGYLIGWYLWLISLAEGAHIAAHLGWLYYRSDDYRPLEKIGSFQPFIILALAPLFLMADLGRPERFYTMFYNWHWTSPVAYGVYIISFCIISYALHSYYLFRPELIIHARRGGVLGGLYRLLLLGGTESGDWSEILARQRRRERFWAGVSLAFSFLGLIYLGVLLSSFKGRVMWSSSMMVFIFASLGLTGGSAFLVLLTHLKNLLVKTPKEALARQQRYLAEFGVILKYSLVAQAAVWFVYLALMQYTGAGGRLVGYLLMEGPRAFQFWFFQAAVGLALPFALTLFRRLREKPLVASLAAAAALAGTMSGVMNIFMGGQSLPMTNFRWEQLAPEPGKVIFGIAIMALMFLAFLVSYRILPYENIDVAEGGA